MVLLLSASVLIGQDRFDNQEHIILRTYSKIKFGKQVGERAVAFVGINDVEKDKQWIPGSMPLPIELGAASEQARQHLIRVNGITNRLELEQVWLLRLRVPDRFANAHGTSTDVFTNNWFVTFSFLPQDLPYPVNPDGLSVLTLLDGVPAKESDALSVVTRAGRDDHPVQSSGMGFQSSTNLSSAAMNRIRRGEFELPKVQWQPMTERFPLDLSKHAIRAKDIVESKEDGKSWQLDSVCIEHYLGLEAIRSKGAYYSDNRNHWWIVFYYTKGFGRPIERAVHMQLDGTIL